MFAAIQRKVAGMDNFRNDLLNALEVRDDAAVQLRLDHVGSVLDTDRLPEFKFKQIQASKDGYTLWERRFDNRKNRILMEMSGNMLMRLRLSRYIDLKRTGGFGAPKGWFRLYHLNPIIANEITEALTALTAFRPPRQPDPAWGWYLNQLRFNPAEWTQPVEFDFALCCYANQYRYRGLDRMASLLTSALHAHLDSINNKLVLTDLPMLCGSLGMHDECVAAIKRICCLGLDISAEGWNNIGNTLCDHVRLPEAALLCFIQAQHINPALPEPQYNLWLAGKKILEQEIVVRGYDRMVEIGERVRSLADLSCADAMFFTALGMAYEALQMFDEARECYDTSLQLKEGGRLASSGHNRLSSVKYNEKAFQADLDRLCAALEYVGLVEE